MFKYGLLRTAAIAVRFGYLSGLFIGIYLYFQSVGIGATPAGDVMSLVIPLAVVLHEFLQQHSVLTLIRQWLRDTSVVKVRNQLIFHGVFLLAATGFDVYCVVHLAPALLVLPFLFGISSVLIEADEDAGGLLARNAHAMLMRTTKAMMKQWKTRTKTSEKNGLDLSNVGATLMEDAGNIDDARRIRIINQALNQTEQDQPKTSLRTKSGKSSNLYYASAQAQPGAKPTQFQTQTMNENPDEIQGKRKPRRAVPRSPKARIYRILDRMENPAYADVTEIARGAKCDWKTAKKYYDKWCDANSIELRVS